MFDPGIAMLGLGLAGDAFGAYSAQQQQSRQRDLYNKMLEYNNPAAVLARQQQFYNANVGNLNQNIPAIMRQTVNPMLGMKGIDPMGGQGQMLLQQSLAPYYQQAWNQAGDQAQGGLQALNQAGGQVGTPYGTMGGTAAGLQSLMLMNALRGGNRQQTQQPSTPMMANTSNMQPTSWEEMTPWQSTSYGGNQV